MNKLNFYEFVSRVNKKKLFFEVRKVFDKQPRRHIQILHFIEKRFSLSKYGSGKYTSESIDFASFG